MVDLQEIIQDTLELEPLPRTATRLVELVGAEEIDLDEIIEVVRYDQSLSARTLSAANAATGLSLSAIVTIEAAVVRLGPAWILSLAMASAVQSRLETPLPQFGLDEGELWRHSMCTSIAAEQLREMSPERLPLETPSTALLHDIGQLVLARHVRRHMQLGIRRACREQGLSGLRAESEILNINHAELGAMVARHWGLPESIALGIAYHHHPSEAPDNLDPLLPHSVHLADTIAEIVRGGTNRDYLCLPEFRESLERLSLRTADLPDLCRAVEVRASAALGAAA